MRKMYFTKLLVTMVTKMVLKAFLSHQIALAIF